jgi:transposase-like protein
MESTDFESMGFNRARKDSRGNSLDHHNDITSFLGDDGKKLCPKCGRIMQKSGQKADSNGVIKQRFLCPTCKKTGQTPYNYFFLI